MTRSRQPPRTAPLAPHDRTAQTPGASATWNDLVLPVAITGQLRQVAADMAACSLTAWNIQDKRGVSAIFTGPSGTGKTLAAQVLAHELKLDLTCVNLAAVVSQYVGETEKKLGQVFDAALDGGFLLSFDEADALFGKRSEVKDAHGRYANQESSYLLQRIESHPGPLILATNRKAALDPAFIRRLRHVVAFPLPGAAERRLIWARALPAEAQASQSDIERLTRFPLSGGNIRAIELDARLHAAQRGSTVTPALIFEAVRRALEKLGRPISEEDFC